MEIAQPPITTAAKSPETETDNPTRIQPAKPISFTNSVLKRHNNSTNIPITQIVISYKECLKNHAAALGGHALDGCGEFMPSPTSTPTDPTSIKCAACGCHRNFHRREPEDSNLLPPLTPATHVIEYQPHHRHRPPAPLTRSPNSTSPPPISSSYYPSAPHMLLALSTGISENPNTLHAGEIISPVSGAGHSTRKRCRTKFSQDQKEKMFRFAERVGWKMQKRDEDVVGEFCNEIGVDKGVLKVWMHNNKNTFVKRDEGVLLGSNSGAAVNNVNATVTARIDNNSTSTHIGHRNQIHHDNMNGNNDNHNNITSNEDEDEDEDEDDDDHPRQLPSHHHHNGGGSLRNLGSIANPNHHHYQVGRDHPHGGSSSSS